MVYASDKHVELHTVYQLFLGVREVVVVCLSKNPTQGIVGRSIENKLVSSIYSSISIN